MPGQKCWCVRRLERAPGSRRYPRKRGGSEQLQNGIDRGGADLRDLKHNAVERAHLQGDVQRNGYGVHRRSLVSQPNVASLLPNWTIAKVLQYSD